MRGIAVRDENSRTETIENSDDPIIWGAEAIGREVGLDERAAFYALERGFLPANKVGKKMGHDPATPAPDCCGMNGAPKSCEAGSRFYG
jgi:hypothetical protein